MSFRHKTLVKSLTNYSHSEKMSDSEHLDRVRFITGTILGSGYECKDYHRDFLRFQSIHQPKWATLYERWVANGRKEWACFDISGKLEFVKNGGEVTESHTMPNQWASGSGILETTEHEDDLC